mmetsp:Transcript_24847/g.57728  ORF Transcript_24847/g.57728 Transcript_24847/m.57728 type:complete len:238 (-) Transcript_24847:107-820(-)
MLCSRHARIVSPSLRRCSAGDWRQRVLQRLGATPSTTQVAAEQRSPQDVVLRDEALDESHALLVVARLRCFLDDGDELLMPLPQLVVLFPEQLAAVHLHSQVGLPPADELAHVLQLSDLSPEKQDLLNGMLQRDAVVTHVALQNGVITCQSFEDPRSDSSRVHPGFIGVLHLNSEALSGAGGVEHQPRVLVGAVGRFSTFFTHALPALLLVLHRFMTRNSAAVLLCFLRTEESQVRS